MVKSLLNRDLEDKSHSFVLTSSQTKEDVRIKWDRRSESVRTEILTDLATILSQTPELFSIFISVYRPEWNDGEVCLYNVRSVIFNGFEEHLDDDYKEGPKWFNSERFDVVTRLCLTAYNDWTKDFPEMASFHDQRIANLIYRMKHSFEEAFDGQNINLCITRARSDGSLTWGFTTCESDY